MTRVKEIDRDRTAIALRFMEEQDYEATGQLPAPYKPQTPGKRRAVKAAKVVGKVAGYSALYAGKGLWAVTKCVFVPMSSRREIHITIIEREDPFAEIVALAVFCLFVVFVIAAIGSAGGA